MASANDGAAMSSLQPLPEKPSDAPSPSPRRRARSGGEARDGVKCTALCGCPCLPRLIKKKRPAQLAQPVTIGGTSANEGKELPSARRVSSWRPSSSLHAASAGAAGRTSASQLRESTTASFSHWIRSQVSGRVMQQGAAPGSFSFPSSPASASSGSGLSTPKLAHDGMQSMSP
ncbi:hypothetical protein ABZP36_025168 [Zizania latifolia]